MLYVEDRVDFREEMVARHLSVAEVVQVSTVRAALIVLSTPGVLEFDLALLDYELPDGEGSQVIAELRRHSPRVLVVGVSADRHYNQRLLDAGADRAMVKSALRRAVDLLQGLGLRARG